MAQGTVGVELRGGVTIPTSELNGADLKIGSGYEILLSYELIPNGGVYAGWGWTRMASKEIIADVNTDIEETGYRFGVEYGILLSDRPILVFVTAGGLLNHLELENEAGDIFEDTGHGFGYQLGAGVDYQIIPNLHLRPGLKYSSLDREMQLGVSKADVSYRYLSLAMGLQLKF